MEAKFNPVFLRRLLALLPLAIFMTCFLMGFLMDTIECAKHKVPSWKKHSRHHIPSMKKHLVHHIPIGKKHPWHHIPPMKKHLGHHIPIGKKHLWHHIPSTRKHLVHHIPIGKNHLWHNIPSMRKHRVHHIPIGKKHPWHHLPMKKHLGKHIPSVKKLKSKSKGRVPHFSIPNPTRMPSLPKATFYSSWKNAFATFYGDETASKTMGGACGYGNLYNTGYGTDTTALSSTLFNNGYGCGGCYEIRCVTSPHCYVGKTIRVTATNLCPANPKRPTNNGGWCNPPRVHFDMSKPAFMKLAWWRSGIVPVIYRRVSCVKKGGLVFTITGNNWWSLILITNVGGPGDISKVSIKGSNTRWIPMSRNWGALFQVFRNLKGQSLSFSVTSYTSKKTIIAWNVAPPTWRTGQTYKSIMQLQ